MSVLNQNLPTSTVYGPVRSWRVGNSLGVDLLFSTSVCSFKCIYCQLGKIEVHTAQRRVHVQTEQVLADLARLSTQTWNEVDVITLSGNGEPTLALNLGEVLRAIKSEYPKPTMVLTNGVHLNDPAVRAELAMADRVFIKLDASDDAMLQRMNHPVDGVTLASILKGILAFKADYHGYLAIQSMFMPMNLGPESERDQIVRFAALLDQIQPDEVQLNTPLRPVPREWVFEARGNHGPASYPTVPLKTITPPQAQELQQQLRKLTGLKITSVYRESEVST